MVFYGHKMLLNPIIFTKSMRKIYACYLRMKFCAYFECKNWKPLDFSAEIKINEIVTWSDGGSSATSRASDVVGVDVPAPEKF
jgi:hypothetical protein